MSWETAGAIAWAGFAVLGVIGTWFLFVGAREVWRSRHDDPNDVYPLTD